jgi:hypothetical protein
MKKEEQVLFYLILFHVVLGALVYALTFIAKLYGYSIFIRYLYYHPKK